MRPPELVTPPAETPVTLEEAKAHLRVDFAEDDALIEGMIAAATQRLDGWSGILGRAIVTQSWRQDFDTFCRRLRLSLPASAIETVTWRDADGQLSTVATADYGLDRDAIGSFVRFRNAWPAPGGLYETGAVSVTFTAGYGVAADVPPPIKAALLLMVGDLYAHRATVSDQNVALVPMSTTVDALLSPYRRWSI